MKNIVIFLMFLVVNVTFAQSSNIKQLRKLLNDAPNQFSNLQKNLIADYDALGTENFSTTISDKPNYRYLIVKSEPLADVMFLIFIDGASENSDEHIFNTRSNEYLTEFKLMSKSGKYKVEDVTEVDNRTITLKNNSGNNIAEYANIAGQYKITIYGSRYPRYIYPKKERTIPAETFNFVNSTSEVTSIKKTTQTLKCIRSDGTNNGEIQHKNRDVCYIIKDRGEWTSVNLNQEKEAVDVMLKSGLYSEKDFNLISSLATEKTYAPAISTFMLRKKNRDMAQNYTCLKIAEFTNNYATYAVLWIPKEDNKNVPDQMQPTSENGFYMVINSSSVSTEQQSVSQKEVYGLENGIPVTGTTASGIQYTIMSENISTNLGCMAIYVGQTMYVVSINGKKMDNQDYVSAKAAATVGVSDFKYQWFPANNCETLKYKYANAFNIKCGYNLTID